MCSSPDVVLPGIDGREATQKLPKLAALYTTGYTKKTQFWIKAGLMQTCTCRVNPSRNGTWPGNFAPSLLRPNSPDAIKASAGRCVSGEIQTTKSPAS